jgi:aspartyl-tRNA synthetase
MSSTEEPTVLGEDGQPLSKSALKKLQKQQEKEAKKREAAEKAVFLFSPC